MLTGSLCRAARALVEIGRAQLAATSHVEEAVIASFEAGTDTPDEASISRLQSALEDLGAVFLPEEDGTGAGVRLKFSRGVTKRIDTLENEGGPPSSDDVP